MSHRRLLTKLQFPQQQTYGQPPVLWHSEMTRHSRHYIHSYLQVHQISVVISAFMLVLKFQVIHICPALHRPVGVITYLWYVFFPQHMYI